jgi:hypothetical protein
LEVYNASVASLLRSTEGFRSSPIAGIWHEVRELSSSFLGFHISVIGREGNEVAHVLKLLLCLPRRILS